MSDYKPFFDDPTCGPVWEDYPDTDAVVLKDITTYRLHPDGRITTTVRRAVKIFSEFGRDRVSDTHITYHEKRQKLTVLGATTFMCDGLRKDSPEVTRMVMTPAALDRAPGWADFQTLVITNVATERGAVKIIEYEVEDLEPWQPCLARQVLLGETYPVLEKVVTVEMPKGNPLRTAAWAGAPEPKTSTGEGTDAYTWTVSELPAFPAEDGPQSDRFRVPRIGFASLTPAELARALAPELEKKSKADDAIGAWAGKTVEDETTSLGKVLKIHNELLSVIRAISWPVPAGGFSGRRASETFASRHGNALEAGCLLKAALSALDLQSSLVLADEEPVLSAEVPAFRPEVQVWLEVGLSPKPMLLRVDRPAHGAGPNHTAGMTFLRMTDGARLDPAPGPNAATVTGTVTLDKDLAAAGKARVSVTGSFNPFLRMQTAEGEEVAKGEAQGLAGKVYPAADMEKFDFSRLDPTGAELALEFKAPALAEATRDLFFYELPPAALAFAGLSPALHRAERKTFFDLSGPFRVKTRLEITLPEGIKVPRIPDALSEKIGAFRVKRSWTLEDRKLTLEEDLEASGRYLDPDDYPAFRKTALTFLNPAQGRVVLEKV